MLINSTNKKLPPTHDYLRGLLGDAVWLITSKVEEEEGRRQRELLPRQIDLRIRLMSSTKRLPVSVRETVRFGVAYDPRILLMYSSGTYDMGTPRMYYDDPVEYWRTEASTNYLRLKTKT